MLAAPVGGATKNPRAVQYVIEKCTSEWDGIYTEVLKTTSGSAKIVNLEAGQSYR